MTLPPRPPAALGHPEALGSTIRVAALVLAALCCLSCARAHNRTGCGSWIPGPDSTVCCEKCHPGNRPVKKCGKDPKELCRPCTQGTYILSPADHICTMCTQCIGMTLGVSFPVPLATPRPTVAGRLNTAFPVFFCL
ncbi:tumor necrosis factor receptor superfamily member 9-like isoform X1 [Arapaima gigas]